MALENAEYISQLVPTNPPGTDQAATSDDHLRVIKRAVQQSFPNINGVVNATPAQMNGLTGLGNNVIVYTNASGILTTSTYTAASLSRISNVLTGNRALFSGADGDIESHATVTDTELGYLDGVTSAIQTQLDGKSPTGHVHILDEDDFNTISAALTVEYAKYEGSVGSGVTTWNYDPADTGAGFNILRSGTYRISGHHGLTGASATANIYVYRAQAGEWAWTQIATDSVTGSNANQNFSFDLALTAGDFIGLLATSGAGTPYLDHCIISADERLFGTP